MKFKKIYFTIIYTFLAIGIFCQWFADFLAFHKIDQRVLSMGNIILALLTFLSVIMYNIAIKNSNPNVFIRAVMAVSVIKLMILAVAVALYLNYAGPARSLNAVLCTMFLYVIYTAIEVRYAMKMNVKAHGQS